MPLGVSQTFQKHNGICYGVQHDICIVLLWLLLVFSMNVFSVLIKSSKLLININRKADFTTQTTSLQLFPAKKKSYNYLIILYHKRITSCFLWFIYHWTFIRLTGGKHLCHFWWKQLYFLLWTLSHPTFLLTYPVQFFKIICRVTFPMI